MAFDGPDLDEVAQRARLAPSDVVGQMAGADLRVAFLGFLPGFAYLDGLPPSLASVAPAATPRTAVAAGSVGIGGGFAGIYPQASPGGGSCWGAPVSRCSTPTRRRSRPCNPATSSTCAPWRTPGWRRPVPGHRCARRRRPRWWSRTPVCCRWCRTSAVSGWRAGGAGGGGRRPLRPQGCQPVGGQQRRRRRPRGHRTGTAPSLRRARPCRRGGWTPRPRPGAGDRRRQAGGARHRVPGGTRAGAADRGDGGRPPVLPRRVGRPGGGPGVRQPLVGRAHRARPRRPAHRGRPRDRRPEPAPGSRGGGGGGPRRTCPAGDPRARRARCTGLRAPHHEHLGGRGRRRTGWGCGCGPKSPSSCRPRASPRGEWSPGRCRFRPTAGPWRFCATTRTVGGYPVVATVVSADLGILGRCRPGDDVRFEPVDFAEAQRARAELRRRVERAVVGWYPVRSD